MIRGRWRRTCVRFVSGEAACDDKGRGLVETRSDIGKEPLSTMHPASTNEARNASFTARITPSSVHRGSGATGRYTRMSDALVEIEGAEDRRRTVMSFGDVNAAVTRRIVAGRAITLECTWKGRTLLVVGWPRKEARS